VRDQMNENENEGDEMDVFKVDGVEKGKIIKI
jgi:hypothetical protein